MRIFFDTEFIDTGRKIHLISIGLVRADGEEYYAESKDVDLSRACDWVKHARRRTHRPQKDPKANRRGD